MESRTTRLDFHMIRKFTYATKVGTAEYKKRRHPERKKTVKSKLCLCLEIWSGKVVLLLNRVPSPFWVIIKSTHLIGTMENFQKKSKNLLRMKIVLHAARQAIIITTFSSMTKQFIIRASKSGDRLTLFTLETQFYGR